MSEKSTREWIESGIQELRTLRDEIRVDVHLAGMEAKDRWKELEPLVKKTEKLAGDVSEVSKRAVGEILQKVRDFRDVVKHSVGGSHRASS